MERLIFIEKVPAEGRKPVKVKTADGLDYAVFDAKVADSIHVGNVYACTVEIKENTKDGRTYTNRTIKQAVPEPVAGVIPPAPATAAPPPSLVQAAQAAGATVVEPRQTRDNSTNLSIEWQVCVKAGVELATCEGCPQWFSDGIYEVLALKLGIEIPEVPANGQPTPQQWNEYNALVKGYTLENMTALEESIRKSQGVDVRALTGKQLGTVIATIKGKKGTK